MKVKKGCFFKNRQKRGTLFLAYPFIQCAAVITKRLVIKLPPQYSLSTNCIPNQ